MKDFNSFKYSCLFGGGAIRGAAHVGVIKALGELGIQPYIYGGSSVGSIVAALWALGYTYEELAELFLSVNFELFRDISFGFNKKFAFSKGEVFLNWIRELIEKKYYGNSYKKGHNAPVKFKDINKRLVIITTNIRDFSCNEFSTDLTPDFEIALAVRISCCMPGLMRAVSLEDKLLVDGDLMKGKPMWSLSETLKNSDSRILEIRLEGTFDGSDSKPVEYVNGMYTCMTYSETDFVRSIYEYYDKYDYLVINTGNVVVVDFNYPTEKRQQIIDSGYEQTQTYFREFLTQKKQKLRNIYISILTYLGKIQKSLQRGKYRSTKSLFGELFIYLSEYADYIDKDIYEDIKKIQKLLFANVKEALLGYSICTNKSSILTHLDSLMSGINSDLDEFSKYLAKFSV